MSKSSDRRMSLLEDFKLNKVLSYQYIMDKYQVGKRTVQGDVETLNNMGYSIAVARSGEYKGQFVMKEVDQEDQTITYDLMNGIAGDVIILMKLQDESGKKLELTHDELYRKLRGEDADGKKQKYYGDRFAWYTNAIARLKDAKCIRERKVSRGGRTVRTYQLDINAPRFVKVMSDMYDEDNIVDFFSEATERLADYADGQDSKISNILSKLQLYMDGETEEQGNYYIRRERWSDEESALDQIKSQLIKYPYMTKGLAITHMSRDGIENQMSVKVGVLLFAKSTNTLYVLGENIDNHQIINIPVQRITKIKELDVKNDIYGSKKYLEALKYMFGASGVGNMEEFVEVEVEFAVYGNVVSKLNKLVESRNKYGANAMLIYNDNNTVTYKDKMFSVSDLKVFLRGFGSACTVIKPQELRDDMKLSAERILEQYKKEGYNI